MSVDAKTGRRRRAFHLHHVGANAGARYGRIGGSTDLTLHEVGVSAGERYGRIGVSLSTDLRDGGSTDLTLHELRDLAVAAYTSAIPHREILDIAVTLERVTRYLDLHEVDRLEVRCATCKEKEAPR